MTELKEILDPKLLLLLLFAIVDELVRGLELNNAAKFIVGILY